jgi:hypothetical protein
MAATIAALALVGRLALTLVLALVAVRAARAGIRLLEGVMLRATEASEALPGAARKRVATLTGLLGTIAVSLVWATAVVILMGELGLDVAPVLAGAGIVGLAVGFGAQNLVRDVISGFFLVLENHVRVGDVAVINGTGGLVESITYRVTVLRDLAGVVHVFPIRRGGNRDPLPPPRAVRRVGDDAAAGAGARRASGRLLTGWGGRNSPVDTQDSPRSGEGRSRRMVVAASASPCRGPDAACGPHPAVAHAGPCRSNPLCVRAGGDGIRLANSRA